MGLKTAVFLHWFLICMSVFLRFINICKVCWLYFDTIIPPLLVLVTWWRDTNRNDQLCRIAHGGQGKQGGCFHGAKLQIVPLKNFANGNTAFIYILMDHLHWRHLLAKRLATATVCKRTCLGHLGRCNTDRIISIYFVPPKVAKESKEGAISPAILLALLH